MDTEQKLPKLKRGQQLQNAQKLILISKLVDHLSAGYVSTYKLSKLMNVSQETVNTYRPLADKLINENKIDRNVIRNLQIKRTYLIIENLIEDLAQLNDLIKATKSGEVSAKVDLHAVTKSKALIYGQIYKFSSHLALITGLNVETHVNIDPTQLVIIRSNKRKTADRVDKQLLDAGKEIVEQS